MDCLRTRCGHPVVPTCEGLAGCKAQGLWGGTYLVAGCCACGSGAQRVGFAIAETRPGATGPAPSQKPHATTADAGCRHCLTNDCDSS